MVHSVQQKMELRFCKNCGEQKDSPKENISMGNWGPLWLIHKFKGERDKKDRTIWHAEFPFPKVTGNGTIRLNLKFPRALPESDTMTLSEPSTQTP